MKLHFPDWKVHRTGWSQENAKKLAGVVAEVAGLLGAETGEIKKWTSASANEAGLDVLCFRSFNDERVSSPALLFQCASGMHYNGKLHTPNLRVWEKIVIFPVEPSKAFATPFALTDQEFLRAINIVNGPLLDRYRLLAPAHANTKWLSQELSDKLVAWTEPRIATLPAGES
ncbi:MAG: hypothetical protein QM796_20715 [Chthoniobacteraceae bacterium]